MAKDLLYECRRCGRMTTEPLDNYTSHPNSWVYFDSICESCSDRARSEYESLVAGNPHIIDA